MKKYFTRPLQVAETMLCLRCISVSRAQPCTYLDTVIAIWISVILKFLNTDKEIYHSNDVHLFPQLLQTPAGRVWAASRCLRGVFFIIC